MHYPPARKNADGTLLSVTDQKNPCLYLLYFKLGLASDLPTQSICWTERIYPKTSTTARELNDSQPYKEVYESSTLDLNDQLNRKIDETATYGARLFVSQVNVLEDISRVKADPDWKLFTLPAEDHEFVPIYKQPFHGAVKIKTGQFHFYTYHSEIILRGKISERFVRMADTIVNVFAALVGITTVRHHGFANFKKSSITDASTWKDDQPEKRNALEAVLSMRFVEKHHNHRFRLSQLSPHLLYYAEREGLVLDDDAKDSPILQLNKHMSTKAGLSTASKILPDGTPFNLYIARKGHATQAANGFPQLIAHHDKERPLGWPTLKRGRETQRASDWAGLRQTTQNRVAEYRENLQQDVDKTNKRKQEEDSTFTPPPTKRGQPARLPQLPRIRCPECNSKVTEARLKDHMHRQHPKYSLETPIACDESSCPQYFGTDKEAADHFRAVHTPKVACPECSRSFRPGNLKRHRRDQHGVDV